jgi:high-affinity iron transporter
MKTHGALIGSLLLGIGVATTAVAKDDSTASQLYLSRCAFCHGAEGKGDGIAGDALNPKPTDFTSAEFWEATTAEKLNDAIMDGKPGTAMVPFRKTLTAEQIAALVEYLRTFAPK